MRTMTLSFGVWGFSHLSFFFLVALLLIIIRYSSSTQQFCQICMCCLFLAATSMKWIDAKMKVRVHIGEMLSFPSSRWRCWSVYAAILEFRAEQRQRLCLFLSVCAGAGSDRQPKLQDNIYVGQCCHDHSTHPQKRSCGGGCSDYDGCKQWYHGTVCRTIKRKLVYYVVIIY